MHQFSFQIGLGALLGLCGSTMSSAATAFFLGSEYQAQAGPNAGTIRGGNPATDPIYAAWLQTAGLGIADVSSNLGSSPKAVWGKITTPATGVVSYSYTIGSSTVTATSSGWSNASQTEVTTGGSVLTTFGNNSTTLQAGAPRPGFASGASNGGSGYYLGTDNGGGTDNIRNAVRYDLSQFSGGGVYAFGVFGGDLETGGTGGSPLAFLRLTFVGGSTQTISILPDSSLFKDTSYSPTGNNEAEVRGNETTRFIGIASDDLRITSALFVVGDDDNNDNGDSEQLSFIAGGVTFLDASGVPVKPTLPIPEPSTLLCVFLGSLISLRRQR